MDKPAKHYARPLSTLTSGVLAQAFAKQGFAASELVTRWADIVGPEIAAHAEPIKMQWQRTAEDEPKEPATLVLRVEGPAAIEIQHLARVILERVNRFFGWQAVAPLLFGVSPHYPEVIASAAGALLAAAILASYLGAFRVRRIDPAAAMRSE